MKNSFIHKYFSTISLVNSDKLLPNHFFKKSLFYIKKICFNYWKKYSTFKIRLKIKVHFSKITEFEEETDTNYFSSIFYQIISPNLVHEILFEIFSQFYKELDSYTTRGSGWRISYIQNLNIEIIKLHKIN